MIFKKKNSSDTSASTSGENAIANKEVEGLSQGQIVRRRFFRHRAAVFSLGTIIFITVFVFTALDFRFLGMWHVKGWWKWSPQDLPELRFGDCPNDTIGCPTISFRPKFLGGNGIGL
ncbi:MAG: ABC transporter permease, partial [Actinobacteria bacterium]|nr:ABC transporter permease [Actinomycetota bacterium]